MWFKSNYFRAIDDHLYNTLEDDVVLIIVGVKRMAVTETAGHNVQLVGNAGGGTVPDGPVP